MSKKKSSPRAPFVVTVTLAGASALAFLPACGSETTITNPPLPETCPVQAPTAGSGCDVQMTCAYDGVCGPSFTCTADSVWVESSPGGPCNPPAPECPQDPSVSGTACSVEAQTCDYQKDLGCGLQPVQLQCVSGVWQLNDLGPTCNPPPPEPCSGYGSEGACTSDPGCRWLTPGCGEPPLPSAGCHALMPCEGDADCMPGNTCQTFIYNPCAGQPCDACGAGTQVCSPSP